MNMQHTATIVILVVFVLLLSSCSAASTSSTVPQRGTQSLPQTVQTTDSTLANLGKGIATLQLIGTLNLKGAQTMSGLPFEATIAQQDSFQMTIGAPFGITAAKMYANRTNFVLVNYVLRQVYDGNIESKELAAQLPIPIDMPSMMSLMSGKIPGNVREFSRIRMMQDGSSFLYERKTSSGIEFAVVDTVQMVLKQYQRKDTMGVTLVNISLGEVTIVDGVAIPFAVDVTVDNKRQEASFRFSSAVLNQPISKPLTLSIPSSFSRTTYR